MDAYQRSQLPQMVVASLVKHSMTQDGYASLEFRVRKWKGDGSGRPEELLIYVMQNNQSLVTEVRILGDQRIYEICHATILPNQRDNTFIKVLFAHVPEVWLLEFESMFKVY